ncbi:MAG TPA: hypothetical protein H9898_09010 [Candidatus Anaerobiospirillum stercoravium]|nr:hypothetical protein [Candidatus Anaerobiospirillum stercoravium]
MDQKVRSVTNITELILALYDQVPTMKVTGALANNLYYASRNLKLITLTIVVLFGAIFSALYWPNLMVPVIVVCLGLLGLLSLPIIYLALAQVSLRTLSKVRRNYRIQRFSSGSQELEYALRSGTPTTAQGERNLRSLHLVLPLHHRFKFRHHDQAEPPENTLDALAASAPKPPHAEPELSPEPIYDPGSELEPQLEPVVPEASAPSAPIVPESLGPASAPSWAPQAAPAPTQVKAAKSKAARAQKSTASSAAAPKPKTTRAARKEPQVLTRVVSKRKPTKSKVEPAS